MEITEVKINEYVVLQAIVTELYISREVNSYVKRYTSEMALLDSEWDYHWVCSNIAGCISQIKVKGGIYDFGSIPYFTSFKFISEEILNEYFPEPNECPIFIANLYLRQKLLNMCVAQWKAQNETENKGLN